MTPDLTVATALPPPNQPEPPDGRRYGRAGEDRLDWLENRGRDAKERRSTDAWFIGLILLGCAIVAGLVAISILILG